MRKGSTGGVTYAIEEAWLTAIDQAARTLLGQDDRVGEALSREVALLSEVYTRDRNEIRRSAVQLAARLRFFLLRDLAKVTRPIAELGLERREVLRVLDLGAGLGTSTLGIARAAKKLDLASRLEVIAVEREPRLVDVMRNLTARAGQGVLADVSVPISLTAREMDLERLDPRAFEGRFDLVVIGLALNELFTERDEKIDLRADFLERFATLLSPDGALIVLEPALKASTRELMAVRDTIVARGTVEVIAPCTAKGACPLLRRERDWCHADDDLTLPGTLAEVAQGAGLRWEGLSYAYLTLATGRKAKDGYRVVGGPVVSKGRTELHLCRAPRLVRLNVLHRDEEETGRLEDVRRGAVLALAPEPEGDTTVRAGRGAKVTIVE
jgi:ribosomal protein RSM22 (predicted rRNA methylase)